MRNLVDQSTSIVVIMSPLQFLGERRRSQVRSLRRLGTKQLDLLVGGKFDFLNA